MRALNRTWQQVERERDEEAGDDPAVREAAEAVRRVRQRLSVAETARYYAHRRYQRSGDAADREAWEARQRECVAAEALLRRCEAATEAMRAAGR